MCLGGDSGDLKDMGISKLTLADDGSSVGGVGYQGRGNLQPRNLTTIAPTSEEAKQKLRALQGAQGVPRLIFPSSEGILKEVKVRTNKTIFESENY